MSKTMKPTETKKALGYLRISDKKQIKGESKKNQRETIQAYADANGIKVVKWFYDEAKSGKNTEREELQLLLKTALKLKGTIDYVLVYKMNRASRDLDSYIMGMRSVLAARGINVRSATEQFDDSPMGRFIENLYVMVGQLDNENKRDTVIDNMRRIAKQGYWQHKPLLGYEKHTVKNGDGFDRPSMKPSDLSEKVKQLLMRFNRGDLSPAQLTRYAKEIKLKSLYGNDLSQEIITRMIKRPEYAGYLHDSFTDFEIVEGKHPGIITPEVYWQNQRVLKSKNKQYLLGLKHHTINMMYPLRRFLICPNCKGTLTSSAPKNSPRYYCPRKTCRGTGSIKTDTLHAMFEELLASIQPSERTLKLMKEIISRQAVKELGNINNDVAELRKRLDQISDTRANTIKKYVNGKLSDEDKQLVIDGIDQDKLDINEQLEALEQQQTLSESSIEYALNFMANVAKLWADATLEAKQTYQNLVFPNGLEIDIKNRKFIIPEISPLYRYITNENSEAYANNSTLVTSRGIEPRLPG